MLRQAKPGMTQANPFLIVLPFSVLLVTPYCKQGEELLYPNAKSCYQFCNLDCDASLTQRQKLLNGKESRGDLYG